MPRSIRFEYDGAFYHVMARGNRREMIFHDEEDRRTFLRSFGEACGMTGWRVHAWVLTFEFDALDHLVAVHYSPVGTSATARATEMRTTYDPHQGALVRAVTDRAGNTQSFDYTLRMQHLTETNSMGKIGVRGHILTGRIGGRCGAGVKC